MAASYQRRARGEGSLYQTKDGRWRGAYTDPATGVRRLVSGRSHRAASEALARLRASSAAGTAGASPPLADYLASWLASYRPTVAYSTWTAANQVVRCYLVPAFGRVPLAALTVGQVNSLLAGLVTDGLGALTVRHVRAVLRRAIADAERSGLVSRNVAALSRPPRLPYRAILYVPPDELPALLDALTEYPAFVLAATTGLRAGELCGLRWGDVDGDVLAVRRSVVRVAGGWGIGETKTGRSRRSVVLTARAVAALERLRGGQTHPPDAPILTDALGRPLTPRVLTLLWRAEADKLGIPLPLHALRHTAATAMLAAGVPLAVVSDVLGHAGVAVTAAYYAAVVPELRRSAADALNRTLGEGRP